MNKSFRLTTARQLLQTLELLSFAVDGNDLEFPFNLSITCVSAVLFDSTIPSSFRNLLNVRNSLDVFFFHFFFLPLSGKAEHFLPFFFFFFF